ncbi:type II toxin-antitoxin system prevent-host-death family antitoxin [Ramlibacter sp.]|uniref:type II toxin-antitoxin system Phd/YefM family antitoxin n=1 Tax=Ramlibacter sp. TaxID=1917967 RepID=UPI001846E66D|nr:type II toxin-antitoxin system prevent-host-death family antitoxin [Ramlibacter sp.]MBA2674927.1 type II toxin-antitoxin system prevent-host-death family antitoxin [Ramlibacter sp.]
MQTVPIHQAKDRFSALLQAVEEGEEVVITRHGKKIARIVRETDAAPSEAERARLRRDALERLDAFHARMTPDAEYKPGDWKQYRDEGRK